jgi:hypothetical protein
LRQGKSSRGRRPWIPSRTETVIHVHEDGRERPLSHEDGRERPFVAQDEREHLLLLKTGVSALLAVGGRTSRRNF